MNSQIDKRIKNARLTATEQKIAEYISRNHSSIFSLSSLKLGELIGTSDTSVIRTAKKLGFSGYAELQHFLTSSMYDEIERNNGMNFLSPGAQVEKKLVQMQSEDLYEQMFEKINENIRDIFNKNSTESFQEASDIILAAKRKFVMGFHGCAGVAQLLGGSLGDVLSDVRTVTMADSRGIEAILDITETDCLIIVSFPRYAEMAQIVIDHAKKKNAKVIALTDRITSPISRVSDVSLLSGIDSVTINNSYVAPTVVAEMLLATVYRKIGPQEEERLKDLEHYISKYGLY